MSFENFLPLFLGGSHLIRLVSKNTERTVDVTLKNTCCLDVLIMSMISIYRQCPTFQKQVDETNSHFSRCIIALNRAQNLDEINLAKVTFIVKEKLFRSSNVIQKPLDFSTNTSFLVVSLFANDINLCEHLMSSFSCIEERFICEREKCQGTKALCLKTIQILKNSVTETLKCMMQISKDVCRTEISKDECRQLSTYHGTKLSSDFSTSVKKLICNSKRRHYQLVVPSGKKPPLLLFFANHSGEGTIEVPSNFWIFDSEYIHASTTFIKNNHYTAVINFDDKWGMYNGLRNPLVKPCPEKNVFKNSSLTIFRRI
jgi:hypothetical protein